MTLEEISDTGPVILMRANAGYSVQSSATTPCGTVREWSLPDGTPLDPFCLGGKKPYRILSLSAGSPVIVARYLIPARQFLAYHLGIGLRKRFRIGEAVLSPDLPDASQLLPLLLFTFDVLEAINMPEPGGS